MNYMFILRGGKMFKDLKPKMILIIAIFLIIIGIIYQVKKSNKEIIEFDYQNVIVQNKPMLDENIVESAMEKKYIKIHITGQVKKSGIIELESGSRISDAIEKAGGITELANLDEVNLAYCLEDGQKLYIPSIEEKEIEYITEENGENIIEETNVSNANKIVNINKADLEDLETIPGIGPLMAQKIINYRTENGEFKTVEDLKNVSGIGEKKFESMREYINVK